MFEVAHRENAYGFRLELSVIISFFGAFLGLYLFTAPVLADSVAGTGTASIKSQRELFKKIVKDIYNNKFGSLLRQHKRLQSYPLFPYLYYYYYKQTIKTQNVTAIKHFIQRFADTPLAEQLRLHWLKELARREDWRAFLLSYRKPHPTTTLQCHFAYALFKINAKTQALREAESLWQVGRSQPNACDKVFAEMKKAGALQQKDIMHRAILALRRSETRLAKWLLSRMESRSYRLRLRTWLRMHREPDTSLSQLRRREQPLIIHGVRRLAKHDLIYARSRWKTLKQQIDFKPAYIMDMERYFIMRAIYAGKPDAQYWLEEYIDPESSMLIWRIRLAIRNAQWSEAMQLVDLLPEAERKKLNWRYIYARLVEILANTNQDGNKYETAMGIYRDLAGSRTYYGFLAADRLGQTYRIRIQLENPSPDVLAEVYRLPGVRRAQELVFLKRINEAKREWRHCMKKLSGPILATAATVARRWGWYYESILTYVKFQASRKSVWDTPYPRGFRRIVIDNARKQGLDPALIFGVIRQESAFKYDARSHAGALGLMQLMPATAKYVSELTETPINGVQDIIRPDKNIRLGSAYLKTLLKQFNGHRVLAAVAYNAGPHRARAWLPRTRLPADLWVETIPFNETRRYVMNVLAYMVIFDYLIDGNVTPLTRYMTDIGE